MAKIMDHVPDEFLFGFAISESWYVYCRLLSFFWLGGTQEDRQWSQTVHLMVVSPFMASRHWGVGGQGASPIAASPRVVRKNPVGFLVNVSNT